MQTKQGTIEGQFRNDQLNGQGRFTWKDGKQYEGGFKNSKFHGEGVVIYPNKNKIRGTWVDNHNQLVSQIA